MVGVVIALAVTLAGVAGGLIYFARAALSRSDKLGTAAVLGLEAVTKLERKLEKANAQRVAAEARAKRLEIVSADTTDDPILEAFFARALDALNPATRRDLIDGLAAARRVHANRNGDADNPGGGPVSVSGPAGPADIEEFESDVSG